MTFNRAELFRSVLMASAIALAAFSAGVQAQAYNLRVLHAFSGAPNDGMSPENGVHFDSAGNLYGTTSIGGVYDSGTIYKVANDGTETVLHSFELPGFQHQSIGARDIVIDSSTGDIYGTTRIGGDMSGGGRYGIGGGGQIYKLSADGTFTTVHAFSIDRDGVFPISMTRDRQGNFYGILEYGPDRYGSSILFK